MANVTVLDGAMGDVLIERAGPVESGLWSAEALIEDPELVAGVHRDYIAAGAEVITVNSYSTVPSYLGKVGRQDEYLSLATRAGEIARSAASTATRHVRVAGSIPPLGESYRHDLVPPDEEAAVVYPALAAAAALLPFVDVFLCETMSCIRESVNAAGGVRTALREAGEDRPLWLSWTLSETPGAGLRSGESISEALAAVEELSVDAYLFNCTDPAAITQGLEELRDLTDKPMGAYPNRYHVPEGWTLDNEVQTQYREMTEEEFLGHCARWRDAGASLLGGCCGIGPELIGALAHWSKHTEKARFDA
ncbi:MAG: homocysteine S-methyltransferase family protein [Pseudomonadota bacterium]